MRWLSALLLLSGVAHPVEASALQSKGEDALLESGAVLEKAIPCAEAHRYRISANAGDSLRIEVLQERVDLLVSLFADDGKKLAERDVPTGERGTERVSWIAHVAGTYRLEVRCYDAEAPEGRYQLRARIRPATEGDGEEAEAEVELARALELQSQTGIEIQRQAVAKLRESLAFWRKHEDLEREAIVLQSLGHAYAALNEHDKAVDHFAQALEVNRSASDRGGEAYALFSLATMEASLGRTSPAFEHYREALEIQRDRGDRRSEAMILSNLGKLHDSLGEKEKALEMFDRALPLIRSTRNLPFEARTMNRMGALYESQGEQQKAIGFYRRALEIASELKDKQLEGSILGSIGRAYTSLGDSDRALRYLLDALEMVRPTGDPLALAKAHSNLGRAFSERGESVRALKHYGEALALLRGAGDPRTEAAVLNASGQLHFRAGRLARARASFEEALRIARSASDPYREADALTNRGKLLVSMKKRSEALNDFRVADSLRRKARDRQGEAWTAYELARVERDFGHLAEARSLSEQALNALESLRGQVLDPDLRASFFASARRCYELYIDVLMRLDRADPSAGFAALALTASERARARSLLDLLTEVRVDVREGADAALLARERSLRQQWNDRVERQLRLPAAKEAASLAGEIEALGAQLQDLESEIRSKSPRYASLVFPQPLDLKGIQQQVLDGETLLLEYFLGEERSFLWLVSSTSMESYELPKRAEIERAGVHAYEFFSNPKAAWRSKGPGVFPSTAYRQAAGALSRLVLAPVARRLTRSRLLLVGDGVLQYLPFAALPMPGSARPLLLDYEIVSLPSASVFASLRRGLENRASPPRTLAVFADPVFESDDERVVGTTFSSEAAAGEGGSSSATPFAQKLPEENLLRAARDSGVGRQGFPRLPFTRREAKGILSLLPREEGKEVLDFGANKASAMDPSLGQYRFVHFATHGLLNSRHPSLSGIVLSLVDRDGKDQEGFLLAKEIYNLKLPVDLVVLSACRTALGKQIHGEGLVGLTRGFMYAGAAGVVASLWKVDDAATAELMRRFYEEMIGPRRLRPAAALRAAQSSLWHDESWKDPYYWAGFVLQGEGR